jgi:hypothetical protein
MQRHYALERVQQKRKPVLRPGTRQDKGPHNDIEQRDDSRIGRHALAQRQARRISLHLPIATVQIALPTAACSAARKARKLIAPVDEPHMILVAEAAATEMAEPKASQIGRLLQRRAFPAAGGGDRRQGIRRRAVEETDRNRDDTSEENETGTRTR